MRPTTARERLDALYEKYPKHFICPKCGETKSAQSFRYIITLADAEARGYENHGVHPMKEMSPYCNPCNPAAVTVDKLKHMTAAEVNQALIDCRITKQEYAAEMALRRIKHLRPNKKRQAAQDRTWKHHLQRWDWLTKQLLTDHRRARTNIHRHDAGVSEAHPLLLELDLLLRDLSALAMKRVTTCKRNRVSSTEDIPTVEKLLGATRSEALMDAWALAAPYMAEKRQGRTRVVPFLITQLRKPMLDGAPEFWKETEE